MRWVALVTILLLPSACASEEEVPPSLTGLIASIDRSDRGKITGFTLEAAGERYDLRIDPGRDYGFDLEHLEEHRVQSLPVRVTVRDRDGEAYAVEILDA